MNTTTKETTKLRLPEGMSEGEAVAIIYRVVDLLASKFRFGYHSTEDMRQQGAIFAVEALQGTHYDVARPLENFLYTHIRNRFINLKRDKFVRNELPCRTCIFFDPQYKKSTNQCGAFEDKMECDRFKKWRVRNDAKRSLMQPVDIGAIAEPNKVSYADFNMMNEEVKQLINAQLPVALRADFLRLYEGEFVPKSQKERVRDCILNILKNYTGEATERSDVCPANM